MGSCVIFPAGRKRKIRRRRKTSGAKVIALAPRLRSRDKPCAQRKPLETVRALLRWLKPMKPAAPVLHRLAR